MSNAGTFLYSNATCSGMFIYCNKCGLIRLGNKATQKAIAKPCGGLRDLDDDEYLKVTKVKR